MRAGEREQHERERTSEGENAVMHGEYGMEGIIGTTGSIVVGFIGGSGFQ